MESGRELESSEERRLTTDTVRVRSTTVSTSCTYFRVEKYGTCSVRCCAADRDPSDLFMSYGSTGNLVR